MFGVFLVNRRNLFYFLHYITDLQILVAEWEFVDLSIVREIAALTNQLCVARAMA